MKKIKEYCKNNKLFVIVMAIGLILFFLQITQVIMYADDYSLATIAKSSGIAGAWDYFKDNYMNFYDWYESMVSNRISSNILDYSTCN